MKRVILSIALVLLGAPIAQARSFPFNGGPDAHINLGYFALLGGLNTPGSVWYVHDDLAYWGAAGFQTWTLLDQGSVLDYGLGVTIRNGANPTPVYDNTGIWNSSYGGFWSQPLVQDPDSGGGYSFFSMPDNYDNVEATEITFGSATTFDSVTGYFAMPVNFTPDIYKGLKMDFWSQTGGAPTDTNSFNGDVFSVDTQTPDGGTWSVSNTGIQRQFLDFFNQPDPDNIWSVTYTFATPQTLGPGTYYFSHSALATPEPGSLALCGGLGLIGLARVGIRRWRGKKS